MMDLKKGLMKQVWRIQQIGALYSVIMLTVTITLVVFPFIEWRFIWAFDKIGIPTTWDLLMVIIIFSVILMGALTAGYIYDGYLKLWKTQNEVAVERNPYAKNLMSPKEWINWQFYFIPMLRSQGRDDEADFMEKWNRRLMEENPILKKEVDDIVKWVNEYQLDKNIKYSIDKR